MKPVKAWMLKRLTLVMAYGVYHTRKRAITENPHARTGKWVRVEIRELPKTRRGLAEKGTP